MCESELSNSLCKYLAVCVIRPKLFTYHLILQNITYHLDIWCNWEFQRDKLQIPFPTQLLQMRSLSQVIIFILRTRHSYCFFLSSRIQFPANLQIMQSNQLHPPVGTRGHLTLLILQGLPSTASACSFCLSRTPVFIYWGCHNKMPQTGCLKQIFISS